VQTDFGALLPNGERNLLYGSFGHDRVAIESRSIQFENEANGARSLTFSVAVSLTPYEEQLWRFRQQMLGWFGGLMALLLLSLAALLHWVLAPARRMEREIRAVEGRSEALSGATRASCPGSPPTSTPCWSGNANASAVTATRSVIWRTA
jgi:hypothetical protein